MAVIVADANVVVKWLVMDDELYVEQALLLLDKARAGDVRLYEPAHWLAEAAAVLARLAPETAGEMIAVLQAMRLPVLDTEPVYQTACSLAIQLNHHLFDTLYHAVALHLPGARLVTADELYYKKARGHGNIVRLADFA